ncbi:MAG: ATP-binding protein [Nitrospiraceae bacterium]|nr:ATP-binding protein [Nitrospiraceae bacterium]
MAGKINPRSAAFFALLVVSGFAGNYFRLPLFFGADFVFGSVAAMIANGLFGPAAGVAVSLAGSAYTYFLWGHPYAIAVFTAEALFVGLVYRRTSKSLVCIDGIFWLLLGIPMVWFLYYGLLRMDRSAVSLVMFKESVNGILNALLASLFITHMPLRKWMPSNGARKALTLQNMIFDIILLLVFVPMLFVTFINGRDRYANMKGDINDKLEDKSVDAQAMLSRMVQKRLDQVQELADSVFLKSPVLVGQVMRGMPRDMESVYIANRLGAVTSMLWAERLDKGEPPEADISGRPYFREARSTLQPFLSVTRGRGNPLEPVLLVSVPVVKEGRFEGCVSGEFDLAPIRDAIRQILKDLPMSMTLVDRDNAVIASTDPAMKPLERFAWEGGIRFSKLGPGLYMWQPSGKMPSMERWRRSGYVMETFLDGNIPWKLIVEAPVAPHREALFAGYVRNMQMMLFISVIAVMLSTILSRKLASPLLKLEDVTNDLPANLSVYKDIEWPRSSIVEIDSLVGNFREMGRVLGETFYEVGVANAALKDRATQLERANAELKAAQSRILQQEKMASIGQLAAGVAHEINNPIGYIMSNLGTLQKYVERFSIFIKAQSEAVEKLAAGQPEDAGAVRGHVEDQKKALKLDYIMDDAATLITESVEGAERVKGIVRDLKSFSRVDEAEQKMADINAGLESTINIVWNELKYKATLKKEYGQIPLTRCNPGQLNQVFMNLLVNAAQSIGKHGEIVVRTWNGDGNVNVSVSDTGCGIPQDKTGRIFEPFYTTKEVGKGTGLGLSIAYDIVVKKHHGEIKVESEPGKGSVFTVRIPVVEGEG